MSYQYSIHQSVEQPVDESIARVLSTLRAAEPSPEFEVRIIAGLRGKLAASRPSLWRRAWPALRTAPAAAVAIAIVCALVLIPWVRDVFQPKPSTPSTSSTTGTRSRNSRTASGTGDDAAGDATARHVIRGRRAPLHATASATAIGQQSVLPWLAPPPGNGALWRDLSSSELAAAEASAPSKPEPPLPLTAEERQIRRFTERHNAYQLAALDPRTEPAHERIEIEEFRHFFAPPPEPSGNFPLPPLEGADAATAAADPN